MEWAKQSLKTEPQGISTPNQDETKAARKLKTNGQNSRTTKLRQEEEKRKNANLVNLQKYQGQQKGIMWQYASVILFIIIND